MRISEIFLVKADWGRTYLGHIFRVNDFEGNEFVFGKVIIENNVVISKANNEVELKHRLDDTCILILDHNLVNSRVVIDEIAGEPFNLN
jgi:hypothetical protein